MKRFGVAMAVAMAMALVVGISVASAIDFQAYEFDRKIELNDGESGTGDPGAAPIDPGLQAGGVGGIQGLPQLDPSGSQQQVLSGPINNLKSWATEKAFSRDLDDYLISIRLSEDKTNHQVILYGRSTVPFADLKMGFDNLQALGNYCVLAHPGNPTDLQNCVSDVGRMKIAPWIIFPTALTKSRVLEKVTCEAVPSEIVGQPNAELFFRCELTKDLSNPYITGKTMDEIAKEYKMIISGTYPGLWFSTIMLMAASQDGPDISPLIATAAAIVLSDRDVDMDAVPDAVDNCKYVANYDQAMPEDPTLCDKSPEVVKSEQTATAVTQGGTAPVGGIGADEGFGISGSHCALTPGAAMNPMGLLLLMPAVATLLIRRKR